MMLPKGQILLALRLCHPPYCNCCNHTGSSPIPWVGKVFDGQTLLVFDVVENRSAGENLPRTDLGPAKTNPHTVTGSWIGERRVL